MSQLHANLCKRCGPAPLALHGQGGGGLQPRQQAGRAGRRRQHPLQRQQGLLVPARLPQHLGHVCASVQRDELAPDALSNALS